MAAILSCHSMLSHRPLRRGCLIEFLSRRNRIPLLGRSGQLRIRVPPSLVRKRQSRAECVLVGVRSAMGRVKGGRPECPGYFGADDGLGCWIHVGGVPESLWRKVVVPGTL
jgi:hypothetical protein